MKKFMIFLFGVLFLFPVEKAISQEWVVPADQQALTNPYPINNANVKTGKELYMANCRSCHGEPGKFNALPLTPPPPDVTSEQMQANNDGMMHYKITAGRATMPAFEKTLADEQRWKIVAFIKSFDPANAGLLVKEEPIKAKINASTDEATGVISVSAQYQDKMGVWLPLQGADVFIKAKRTFGSLPIGQTSTNDKGYGEYHFPKTFKGDTEGFLDLELSLSEEYAGNIVALNKVKIGAPYDAENLFRERVLWSTNNRTMWWLILAYVGGVAGVWATIGYVIFQVFKIYRAGRE